MISSGEQGGGGPSVYVLVCSGMGGEEVHAKVNLLTRPAGVNE